MMSEMAMLRQLECRGMNLHDERPVAEQIKSGFVIVGKLLAAFAISMTFLAGCEFIRGSSGWHDSFLGWGLIIASIVVMTATVRFWAAGFVGFIAYGALGSSVGILAPSAFHSSRRYMVALFVSVFVMSALSLRFAKKKIVITPLDRASIVIAASCVLLAFLFADTYKGAVVFNAGNVALLLSWWMARASKRVYHKKHDAAGITA
jgi:hypothetical protein